MKKITFLITLLLALVTLPVLSQCANLAQNEICLSGYVTQGSETFAGYKNAMTAASGKTLVIPSGTWVVPINPANTGNDPNDPQNIALVPADSTSIRFESGAILQQETTLISKLRLIDIAANNVHIYGPGTIIGDLSAHEVTTPCDEICNNDIFKINETCTDKKGENTYLIWVDATATNWSIKDVTLKESWGDGIFIGGSEHKRATLIPNNPVQGGLIENVTMDDNRRNGMSVTWSEGLTIKNCVFSNTGQLAKSNGLRRRRPTSGIDVEPNHFSWVDSLTIEDCLANNNIGAGFTLQAPYRMENGNNTYTNVTLTDCDSKSNGDASEPNPQSICNTPFPGYRIVGYATVTMNDCIAHDNAGNGVSVEGDVGKEAVFIHPNETEKAPRIGQAKLVMNGGFIHNNAKHGIELNNEVNSLVTPSSPDYSSNLVGGENEILGVEFSNNGTLNPGEYDNIHIMYGDDNVIRDNFTTTSECTITYLQDAKHNIYIDTVANSTIVRGNKFHVPTIDDECEDLSSNTIWFNNPLIAADYNVCEYRIVSGGGGGGFALQVLENTTFVNTVQATEIPLINNYTIDYTNSYGLSEYHANLFTINSSTGELSFINAPDYENPQTTRIWTDPATSEEFQEYVVDVYVDTNCDLFQDWQRIFVRVKDDLQGRQATDNTSFDTPFVNSQITVTPNPASNQIYVHSNEAIETIAIYTVNGRLVHTTTANTKANHHVVIKLTDISAGLYFVKITTNQGVTTKKIIKK